MIRYYVYECFNSITFAIYAAVCSSQNEAIQKHIGVHKYIHTCIQDVAVNATNTIRQPCDYNNNSIVWE